MARAKMNTALMKQSKREVAYFGQVAQQCFSEQSSFDTVLSAAVTSSTCPVAISTYHYPSPDRPAYSPSRPMTDFRLRTSKMMGDIGYHGEIAIHRGADRTNSGAAEITTIGLRLCKRHQSFSRRWQYLVWQGAWKVTQSAALQVQQAALWLQRCWAQTALAQCLPVLPSVCFATTQVSTAAAKVDNRAPSGRAMNGSRRRGHTPAAAFAFLGT